MGEFDEEQQIFWSRMGTRDAYAPRPSQARSSGLEAEVDHFSLGFVGRELSTGGADNPRDPTRLPDAGGVDSGMVDCTYFFGAVSEPDCCGAYSNDFRDSDGDAVIDEDWAILVCAASYRCEPGEVCSQGTCMSCELP